MSELGIVVVHFHAERLLGESIESLRRSRFAQFSAVVVDNGSTSDLRWVEDDDRFRLLEAGRNLGFAAGTNLGLESLPTTTPFLMLLNPDVVVEPGTIGAMIEVLKENEAIGAVSCRLLLPSGRLDAACRRAEPTLWSAFCKHSGLSRLLPGSRVAGSYNLTYLDPLQPHPIDSGTGAMLMLRRAAFDACGANLDERFFLYGEDLDLCRRIREAGYPLLYWPQISAVHHKGSDRVRSASTTFHFYRAMWLYYRKWGRFRDNALILAPLLLVVSMLGVAELMRNEIKKRFRPGSPNASAL